MPVLSPISFQRNLLLRLFDLGVIVGVVLLLRYAHPYKIDIDHIRWFTMALIPTVLTVFHLGRVYDVLHEGGLWEWCVRAVTAWAMALGVVFAGLFAFRAGDLFPRSMIGLWAVIVAGALVVTRAVMYAIMQRRHRLGISSHRVLVVGHYADCRRLCRDLRERPELG